VTFSGEEAKPALALLRFQRLVSIPAYHGRPLGVHVTAGSRGRANPPEKPGSNLVML
jgi:hypothetical protein